MSASNSGTTKFEGSKESSSAVSAQLKSPQYKSPEYISPEQACSLVGVGLETLTRFIEAGYFPGASKETGIPVAALEDVFGVKIPLAFNKTKVAPFNAKKPIQDQVEKIVLEKNLVSPEASSAESSDDAGAQEDEPSVAEFESVANSAFSTVPRRNVMDMYERLIKSLEGEVKELRSERDWLKTRIERYEEKSSRDQLLMLAEAQTIRNLILQKQQQSSPMRQALQWLGIIPVDANNPTANELQQKKLDNNQ